MYTVVKNATPLFICFYTNVDRSCVCMVSQYAVLEAHARVSRRGQISPPIYPKPPKQYRGRFKYTTTSTQAVDVHNWVWIKSAVTDLRVREKHAFLCGFFIYISLCYYIFGLHVTFFRQF